MHGDQHSECAQAYCEYAKALLRKVQAESSPFGSAGPKPEAKATGEAGSSSADGAAAAAAAPDEGDACDDDDEGGAGEAGGEEGEGEGEGEEEADDLELAFQCFEVARLAYEKAGADESLADVHEFLGEVWHRPVGSRERECEVGSCGRGTCQGPDESPLLVARSSPLSRAFRG